ncbi:MAG TPA: methyl-accepting chemotaxis protein [Thiobacillaceae bacterium]|nr:methyl-accepting chemotaxis protein [Thiobacillaceae bacterium]
MAISLPGFAALTGRMTTDTGKEQHTTMIMQNLRTLADREPGDVPLIGHLPSERQYLYSAGALVASLLLAAGSIMYGVTQSNNQGQYLDRVGGLGMLSQRLPALAQRALQGNEDAFKKLSDARTSFETNLKGLKEGDDEVPASPSKAQAILQKIDGQWKSYPSDIDAILGNEKTLVLLSAGISHIDNVARELQESSGRLSAAFGQTGADLASQPKFAQLTVLAQRMASNAHSLLSISAIDAQVPRQLERDSVNFRAIVDSLNQAGAAGSKDAAAVLDQVTSSTRDLVNVVSYVVGNIQPLVKAKLSANDMLGKSDALLNATVELGKTYGSAGTLGYVMSGVFSLIALGSLVLLGLVNINETKARARKSETENRRNQEAILRLMDELGQLSEGNLTMQATVSEDITGAIADSINFTVDELRDLVRGINNATTQLDEAAREANDVSGKLQQATQRQVKEIEKTSMSVVEISQSVQQVSNNAAESARVAQQALMAAEKGQQAVQNSIAGMNSLREHIQETSKRIKRLGESSQEIGEIVELISDITEQTNVLALNAAIQAASAGEAGRGFSVVAEEVQRLAERSSEATKQIAAIVRTIQSDTHDTVAAMEISTQGVVEGARLSDAAGQTLQEIGHVSKKLATLIQDISRATHSQADATAKVAETMQDIKSITMQTNDGTQQTAKSIGGLTRLAEELKGSVSGFKLN